MALLGKTYFWPPFMVYISVLICMLYYKITILHAWTSVGSFCILHQHLSFRLVGTFPLTLYGLKHWLTHRLAQLSIINHIDDWNTDLRWWSDRCNPKEGKDKKVCKIIFYSCFWIIVNKMQHKRCIQTVIIQTRLLFYSSDSVSKQGNFTTG